MWWWWALEQAAAWQPTCLLKQAQRWLVCPSSKYQPLHRLFDQHHDALGSPQLNVSLDRPFDVTISNDVLPFWNMWEKQRGNIEVLQAGMMSECTSRGMSVLSRITLCNELMVLTEMGAYVYLECLLQVVIVEKGRYTKAAKLSLLERDAFRTMYEGSGLATTDNAGD